jgi:predicted RNase H-like HicB family nuclease
MVKLMKNVFKVVAIRSEGWWALTFPGYEGWHSQGRDETEVEFMAKDLINFDLGISLEEIELDITYLEDSAVAL